MMKTRHPTWLAAVLMAAACLLPASPAGAVLTLTPVTGGTPADGLVLDSNNVVRAWTANYAPLLIQGVVFSGLSTTVTLDYLPCCGGRYCGSFTFGSSHTTADDTALAKLFGCTYFQGGGAGRGVRVTAKSLIPLATYKIDALLSTTASFGSRVVELKANSLSQGAATLTQGNNAYTASFITTADASGNIVIDCVQPASGAPVDGGIFNGLAVTFISAAPPLITSFQALPTSLHAGQSAVLQWKVEPGAVVSITPGFGDVTALTTNGTGALSTVVESNTPFLLVATQAGRTPETNQLTVQTKALITSFAPTRSPLPRGASTVLAWDINPSAASAVISPDIGSVLERTTNGAGWIALAPSNSATYTLTVERNGLTNQVTASLVLTDPAAAAAPDLAILAALWPLNGDTRDAAGPNNALFTGSAAYVLGPNPGTLAAALDGSSFIEAGTALTFDTSSPFSATAWIKGQPGQDSAIIGKMQQGGSFPGWELHAGAAGPGLLNVWLINAYGTSFIQVNSPVNVLDGTWRHVGFTYDGSSSAAGVRIYVDGTNATGSVAANNLSGSILSPASLCVGSRNSGAKHNFRGAVHQAGLWNTSLSAENMAALFQSGPPQPALLFEFLADSSLVYAGQAVALTWQADPEAALTLEPGPGNASDHTTNGSGGLPVTVEGATTFTLTASKLGRTETRQIIVAVKDLVSSFSASRSSVPRGGSLVLSWNVNPLASVTLFPSPGDVSSFTTNGQGCIVVTPEGPTVYTLEAERGADIMDVEASVEVTEPGPATIPALGSFASLWPLNGNTLDVIGTNNALFLPSPAYTTGPVPGALAAGLSGSNYIAPGLGPVFDTATPFSAAIWIKGSLGQDASIIGNIQHSGTFPGWELHVGTPDRGAAPGTPTVWLINAYGANFIQVNSPRVVLDGSWRHVAFTYDGSGRAAGLKIYVDGEDATGAAAADTLTGSITNPIPVCIGSRDGGIAHGFRGALAGAALATVALTPENIRSIYASGVPARPGRILLTDARLTTAGAFLFTWESRPGMTYRIETARSLPGAWTALEEALPSGGASTTYTNPAATEPALFFRVRPN